MSSLTGRPIVAKTDPEEAEKPKRYAWVVCPNCDGWDRVSDCRVCDGAAKVKAELICLAPGSKAKGGARTTTKRTTADAKHSRAVREQWNWCCSVCRKDFEDNPGGLQAMHYVKRRYRALRKGHTAHTIDCCLRHSVDNAAAGCISCHLRLESNPAEHEAHFRGLWGNAHCDALREEAQKNSGKRVKRTVA